MNSMKKLLVAALVVLGIAGCATSKDTSKDNSSKADTEKINVVTTNSIIYDMTKNIAGDLVNLHSIVPLGQDHTSMNHYQKMFKKFKKQT